MTALSLDRTWLDQHPLPDLGLTGDKEDKGRLLIVGGSRAVPGALRLSIEAAMRTGAGKVKAATIAAAAMPLGVAVPEVAVIGLPDTADGEIAAHALAAIAEPARRADAILVGPAMADGPELSRLIRQLLATTPSDRPVVLDAGAVTAIAGFEQDLKVRKSPVTITPHCGEMASLLGIKKDEIEARQVEIAEQAAARFGVVVVLKSSSTVIASPSRTVLRYKSACPGLGTAGSGDVLAGIIGGLLARGMEPLIAAAWAVWLHGACGRMAARTIGPAGFLARELIPFLPRLLSGEASVPGARDMQDR